MIGVAGNSPEEGNPIPSEYPFGRGCEADQIPAFGSEIDLTALDCCRAGIDSNKSQDPARFAIVSREVPEFSWSFVYLRIAMTAAVRFHNLIFFRH